MFWQYIIYFLIYLIWALMPLLSLFLICIKQLLNDAYHYNEDWMATMPPNEGRGVHCVISISLITNDKVYAWTLYLLIYFMENSTFILPWWRHQMETFSASPGLCAGNSPVTDEFPSQRPVTRSFDIFFDLHLKERLSNQSQRRWSETPSRSLWLHCNDKRTRQARKIRSFVVDDVSGARLLAQ